MPNRITQWLNLQVFRRTFSYSVALVVTQLLMVAYTVILIWWLAPESFGIIAANYAAVTMLAFIINWGFNEWLVRTVPVSDHPQALTGSIMRFRFIVGVFWAAALWLLLPAIQPAIYLRDLLAVIILDVFLDTSINLFIADLVGNERVKAASLLLVASRGLRLLGLSLLVLLSSHSVIIISLVRLGCSAAVFVIGWLIARPKPIHPAGLNLRQVFRISIAFNAYEVLNLVYSQIDINLLTWLSGDAHLIGNYAIVSNVVNIVMPVPLGIYNFILPSSIRAYRARPQVFGRRMAQTLAGFAGLGLSIWVGILLLGTGWVPALFGSRYSEGIRLLVLVSPAFFLRSLNQFNNVYLLTVGWEVRRLLPQMITVLAKALIGVFIVIKWQAIGLVWWTIITDALMLSGFSVLSIRHYIKAYLAVKT
jgi:O-antigen/teichoic acid export membrane protein